MAALCVDLPVETAHLLQQYVDVYCDDFCCLAQGSIDRRQQARRHIFHCIDRVFRKNDGDDTLRKDPNSVKKLRNGDAFWTTRKKCSDGSLTRSNSLLNCRP